VSSDCIFTFEPQRAEEDAFGQRPEPTNAEFNTGVLLVRASAAGRAGAYASQFSAQHKPSWSHLPVSPCLIDWGESCTQRIPQNVLMMSQ
jgi:hypothetical protein